ncbi:MAG: hypothetical protein AAF664_07795 [Planctomycetota bacterium]
MSGDLDDFLRRAAQKRKANAKERANSKQPEPTLAPEGGNRNNPPTTARRRPVSRPSSADQPTGAAQSEARRSIQRPQRGPASIESVDEIITAEVVSETAAERRKRIRSAARRAASQDTSERSRADEQLGSLTKSRDEDPPVAETSKDLSIDPALDAETLIAMLRSPGALASAVMIREVLDRPTHRW